MLSTLILWLCLTRTGNYRIWLAEINTDRGLGFSTKTGIKTGFSLRLKSNKPKCKNVHRFLLFSSYGSTKKPDDDKKNNNSKEDKQISVG